MSVARQHASGRDDPPIADTPSTGASASSSSLDAAAELFAANGYAATRIEDICRRGRRRQGPLLLVLPDQAGAVRRARADDAHAAAQGPGRGDGPRRRPADPDPPGHRGERALPRRARRLLRPARRRAGRRHPRRAAARGQRRLPRRRRHARARRPGRDGLVARRAGRGARRRRARRGVVVHPRLARRPPRRWTPTTLATFVGTLGRAGPVRNRF